MDMISEETKLLVSNKINTYEEFFLYRNNIDNKYSELKDDYFTSLTPSDININVIKKYLRIIFS